MAARTLGIVKFDSMERIRTPETLQHLFQSNKGAQEENAGNGLVVTHALEDEIVSKIDVFGALWGGRAAEFVPLHVPAMTFFPAFSAARLLKNHTTSENSSSSEALRVSGCKRLTIVKLVIRCTSLRI